MPVADGVLADLTAETDGLVEVVTGLSAAEWELATPAEGWSIRDSIAHLHATDRAALVALDGGDLAPFIVQVMTPIYEGSALFDDWVRDLRLVRDRLGARAADAPRIPWFGPPMSATTFATSRLMETWAHGVDVRDALGLPIVASGRLRNIADIGVRTRGWAFTVRELPVPESVPFLALAGPDGAEWTWGDPDAPESVRGSALDFCLLVTQRRNPAELDVVSTGAGASQWLSIAQAYAGPAGPGRAPRAD